MEIQVVNIAVINHGTRETLHYLENMKLPSFVDSEKSIVEIDSLNSEIWFKLVLKEGYSFPEEPLNCYLLDLEEVLPNHKEEIEDYINYVIANEIKVLNILKK